MSCPVCMNQMDALLVGFFIGFAGVLLLSWIGKILGGNS